MRTRSEKISWGDNDAGSDAIPLHKLTMRRQQLDGMPAWVKLLPAENERRAHQSLCGGLTGSQLANGTDRAIYNKVKIINSGR